MSHEVGSTVLAIRNGGDGVLNVFGEGVYIGDRPRPGTQDEPPSDDYQAIATVLAQEDATPIEEHRFLVWYDEWVRNGVEVKMTREEVITKIGGDRERPMDERVREMYLKTRLNPCIYLDSGDIVWGMQCWWGPLSAANRKYPESEVKRVLVPVPEGNGRWR